MSRLTTSIIYRYLEVGPWGPFVDSIWFCWWRLCQPQTFLYVSSDFQEVKEVTEKTLPPLPLEEGVVRIVMISDTHQKHFFVDLPSKFHLLLHCGDVLLRNSKQRFRSLFDEFQLTTDFYWIGYSPHLGI